MLKIIFTILLLSVCSHASPLWLSETDFGLIKAGTPNGTTGYKHQLDCESISGESCFDPDDARSWKIEFGLMVSDAAGASAAGIADTQSAADQTTRDGAKTQRGIDMDACVQNSIAATLTLPQLTGCVRALVREHRGTQVPIGDL